MSCRLVPRRESGDPRPCLGVCFRRKLRVAIVLSVLLPAPFQVLADKASDLLGRAAISGAVRAIIDEDDPERSPTVAGLSSPPQELDLESSSIPSIRQIRTLEPKLVGTKNAESAGLKGLSAGGPKKLLESGASFKATTSNDLNILPSGVHVLEHVNANLDRLTESRAASSAGSSVTINPALDKLGAIGRLKDTDTEGANLDRLTESRAASSAGSSVTINPALDKLGAIGRLKDTDTEGANAADSLKSQDKLRELGEPTLKNLNIRLPQGVEDRLSESREFLATLPTGSPDEAELLKVVTLRLDPDGMRNPDVSDIDGVVSRVDPRKDFFDLKDSLNKILLDPKTPPESKVDVQSSLKRLDDIGPDLISPDTLSEVAESVKSLSFLNDSDPINAAVDADKATETSGRLENIQDISVNTSKVDEIKERVNEIKEKISVSAIQETVQTSFLARTASRSFALDDLDVTIQGAETQVEKAVGEGLDKAFSGLAANLRGKADASNATSSEFQRQANAVTIPPVSYADCNCHTEKKSCGKCLWAWKCCSETTCAQCPTADSLQAHTDAIAKQQTLQGQANTSKTEGQQFQAGADEVVARKAGILNDVAISLSTQPIIIQSAGSSYMVDTDPEGESETAPTQQVSSGPRGSSQSLGIHQSTVTAHRLEIQGGVIENLLATRVLNAAVGQDAYASQELGTLGSGEGLKKLGGVNLYLDTYTGLLNAAVGLRSRSEQFVGNVGAFDADQMTGVISGSRNVAAALSASVGNNSASYQRMFGLEGNVGNITFVGLSAAPLSASIGDSTTSIMELGNVDGDVIGSSNITLTSTGAIGAAIGSRSNSSVRLGNLYSGGKVSGNYMNTNTTGGALAASVGYNSEAILDIGNIYGIVDGNSKVSATTGVALVASIGGDTHAIARVATIRPNTRVTGSSNINVTTGLLTGFALGYNTTSLTEIGVVGDGNSMQVTGNVDINITTGEIITGNVGVNTLAETVIGSVHGSQTGDIDIDILLGGVNTFAIGLSNEGNIYSKTYVGNFLGAGQGGKISVNAGAIYNLGFGLVLDLGILGTLRLVEQGCVNMGNRGQSPC
jgi:hypothetical protein